MDTAAIALWIIAFEGLLALIIIIVFLSGVRKDLSFTIKEMQNLLKSLEQRVNEVSLELNNTLKNTTDITRQAKITVGKADRFLTLLGSVGLLIPLFGIFRSKEERKAGSFFTRLLSAAAFLASAKRGFDTYRRLFRKEE